MARTKTAKVMYSMDIAGMWVYLETLEGNHVLLTDRPIIDPIRQELIKESFKNCKPTLEMVTRNGHNID